MVWIQSIDTKILLFIQEHFRMESLNEFWKGITHLGDGGIFWIVLTVLMIVFGLLLQKRIPTFLTIRKAGVASALSMMIGALVAEIVPLIGRQVDYSFPSGHTCASFACALVLYRILPKPYGVPAVILATLIAFSRMYVGVHYPTDILGGFLVALVSSSLAYCLVEGRKKTSVS